MPDKRERPRNLLGDLERPLCQECGNPCTGDGKDAKTSKRRWRCKTCGVSRVKPEAGKQKTGPKPIRLHLTEKICNLCLLPKAIGLFWPNSTTRDGHEPYCKECSKKQKRGWYRQNRERALEQRRILRAQGRVKYYPMAPERRRVYTQLQAALRQGRVIKAVTCERCGGAERIHGHHADYSKPLEVEWLCSFCHQAEHAKERTHA